MPDPSFATSFMPLALAGAVLPTGKTGVFGNKVEERVVSLEAWVCADCGYTDLYARDLDLLSRMASTGKANVRYVERPGKGPYR